MSDILTTIGISADQEHLSYLCLVLIFLINGLFSKKSFFSFIAIIFIGITAYKTVNLSETSSILHFSFDLMLLSAIAGIALLIEKKRFQLLFFPIALISFAIGHHILVKNFTDDKNEEHNKLDSKGEILVQFQNQSDLKKWMALNSSNYDITYPVFTPDDNSFFLDEYLLVDLTDAQNPMTSLRKIEKDKFVAYAEFNEILELNLPEQNTVFETLKKTSSNDPFKDKQWMANQFDLDKFHKQLDIKSKNAESSLTLIAILDTGVDAGHEDLKENYTSISQRSDSDERGHGTHCAGIAAAVTGNSIGIASWIPQGLDIKVTSVKVMTGFGVGTQRTIINGIILAADKGADVISMSLGGPSSPNKEKAYKEAFDYARSKGCIIVVAAGNSNKDAKDYSPANVEGAITIAAIDSKMKKSEFSNDVNSLKMGLAAPGTDIYSTMPKDKYALNSGTSMAAPFVSGIIGLMKHFKPELTAQEAYNYLSKTAIKKDGLLIVDPNRLFEEFLN